MAGDPRTEEPVQSGAGRPDPKARGARVEETAMPARPMSWWSAVALVGRYRLFERRQANARFDEAAFNRIEQAIAAGEAGHRAEIRFALESDLTVDDARSCCAPRERALTAFALNGIWDTAENSGVLIFLQAPLHAVEIVVDRGVSAAVDDGVWREAVSTISRASSDGRPVEGIIEAIDRIHAALATALPARPDDTDELPNRPIRL